MQTETGPCERVLIPESPYILPNYHHEIRYQKTVLVNSIIVVYMDPLGLEAVYKPYEASFNRFLEPKPLEVFRNSFKRSVEP